MIRLLLNWQNNIYKNATFDSSVCPFFVKNFKRPESIINHVTALISEQVSELRLDYSSFAKLSKRDLHPLRNVCACVHAQTIPMSGGCARGRLRGRARACARKLHACVCAHLEKVQDFFISTGIVFNDIGKTRSFEKVEFQCQGAVQGPMHANAHAPWVHGPLHGPLTLEFNFFNWSRLSSLKTHYASWN